jgi:hypothetical protein
MEQNPHPTSSSPASGGLIRLQGRSADLVTRLGPAWATICGVIASGSFDWQGQHWLWLALLILLVDGGWGTLWTALGGTNWATSLRRWRNWRFGEPFVIPPYTLPGSPGDRASRWLGQLRMWWRDIFWPTCGPAVLAIAIALPVTLVLGIFLGTEVVLLSAAALAMMQLGMAWEGGRGVIAPKWNAIISLSLPWLAGHATFGHITLQSAGLALAFALAWGSAWRAHLPWERALGIGTQLLGAMLLAILHNPLAAGGLLLLLTPQLMLLPWLQRGQSASWYTQHTRPWLMAAMLIAAWAL